LANLNYHFGGHYDEIDKKLDDKPADENLSNFNQSLNKALNLNPRKQDEEE